MSTCVKPLDNVEYLSSSSYRSWPLAYLLVDFTAPPFCSFAPCRWNTLDKLWRKSNPFLVFRGSTRGGCISCAFSRRSWDRYSSRGFASEAMCTLLAFTFLLLGELLAGLGRPLTFLVPYFLWKDVQVSSWTGGLLIPLKWSFIVVVVGVIDACQLCKGMQLCVIALFQQQSRWSWLHISTTVEHVVLIPSVHAL